VSSGYKRQEKKKIIPLLTDLAVVPFFSSSRPDLFLHLLVTETDGHFLRFFTAGFTICFLLSSRVNPAFGKEISVRRGPFLSDETGGRRGY